MKNRFLHFGLFLCALVLLLATFPLASGQARESEVYYRGRVKAVDDIEPERDYDPLHQKARVELTSGPFAGQVVSIDNYYSPERPYLMAYLEEGMEIIVVGQKEGNVLREVHFSDLARDRGLAYLFGGLILALLLVGRMQGVRTLLTLAITAVIIARVLLPLLMAGYPPIPVASLSAILIIILILFIIGGPNTKSLAAVLGTTGGAVVAGVLAYYSGELAHLTGFGTDEAQMLIHSGLPVDVRGLLFAGIIIGSLGAITDVTMSVSSAASKISRARPRVRTRELYSEALDVGRDIMGTMANTLILAYVGGAIPLLLIFATYSPSWLQVINLDLIATELVRGITGSIGLIISIPLTALWASFLMSGGGRGGEGEGRDPGRGPDRY